MLRTLFLLLSVCLISTVSAKDLKQAAVATAHPLATEAGKKVLQQGGNAFDAAVAITAALAVVEPYGSGIGGGGFWLIRRPNDNTAIMVDGRETAPKRAHRDMYLDKNKEVIKGASLNGPLAAGIPGIVAGMEYLSNTYGNLPLSESLKPAITYAETGFAVTERYQKLIGFRKSVMQQYPETSKIFLADNDTPPLRHNIIQTDLANTLKQISQHGAKGFYTGPVARKLVAAGREAGGIWDLHDLETYKIKIRKPIEFMYHDIKVTSAAPPSSGGIVLAQALKILEHFDLSQYDEITRKHIVIEAMRRAYRDRAGYLGDPDFVDIPLSRLLDPIYIEALALTIKENQASSSLEMGAYPRGHEPVGTNTTHFSVMDKDGNRVSATLSINLPFGSGFVASGTGVLFNNEMDDFAIKANTPNAYGLIGNHANEVKAGKRPLSSMSPTFLEMDDRIGILGTPGGSRIISMVLLGILDFAENRLPESWVSVPRYHHQFFPDKVQYEQGGLTVAEINQLKAKGHTLDEKTRRYGNMQAILYWKEKDLMYAASDPRGEGTAEVFIQKK